MGFSFTFQYPSLSSASLHFITCPYHLHWSHSVLAHPPTIHCRPSAQNLLERLAEIRAENGVDDRVQRRVKPSEPQEEAHHNIAEAARRAAEGRHQRCHKERQPAHDKRARYDRQRLGRLPLPLRLQCLFLGLLLAVFDLAWDDVHAADASGRGGAAVIGWRRTTGELVLGDSAAGDRCWLGGRRRRRRGALVPVAFRGAVRADLVAYTPPRRLEDAPVQWQNGGQRDVERGHGGEHLIAHVLADQTRMIHIHPAVRQKPTLVNIAPWWSYKRANSASLFVCVCGGGEGQRWQLLRVRTGSVDQWAYTAACQTKNVAHYIE